MAEVLTIGTSLKILNSDPVDRRLILTKAEMLAMKPAQMPRSDISKYFALCSDDNQIYVYDKDAEPDPVTGRFKSISVFMDIADEDTSGLVRSSNDIDNVSVNDDGTMSVNEITTDKLIDFESGELILDGGAAPVQEEEV